MSGASLRTSAAVEANHYGGDFSPPTTACGDYYYIASNVTTSNVATASNIIVGLNPISNVIASNAVYCHINQRQPIWQTWDRPAYDEDLDSPAYDDSQLSFADWLTNPRLTKQRLAEMQLAYQGWDYYGLDTKWFRVDALLPFDVLHAPKRPVPQYEFPFVNNPAFPMVYVRRQKKNAFGQEDILEMNYYEAEQCWHSWTVWYERSRVTEEVTEHRQEHIWVNWNRAYEALCGSVAQEQARAQQERERQARIREEQLRVAEAASRHERARAQVRAESLLLSVLTDQQRDTFRKHKFIDVQVGDRVFRIHDRGYSGNVEEYTRDGKLVASYCAHANNAHELPMGDNLLTQLLILKNDPQGFLKVANRTGRTGQLPAGLRPLDLIN